MELNLKTINIDTLSFKNAYPPPIGLSVPIAPAFFRFTENQSASFSGRKRVKSQRGKGQPVSYLAYRRTVLRISKRRRADVREFNQRNDLLQNTSLKKGTDTMRCRRFRNSPFQVFRLKKTRVANRKCSATGN